MQKTIHIYGKQREILSQDQATKKAVQMKASSEFAQKVYKNHILYGFAHMFFSPVYVTDKELKQISDSMGTYGTIYALHR